MGNQFDSFFNTDHEALNNILKNYRLSPQQLAVIAAILFDALYVKSVLVDREQTIVILLEGTLKRESEEMNKLLDGIRGFNVGELMELLTTPRRR